MNNSVTHSCPRKSRHIHHQNRVSLAEICIDFGINFCHFFGTFVSFLQQLFQVNTVVCFHGLIILNLGNFSRLDPGIPHRQMPELNSICCTSTDVKCTPAGCGNFLLLKLCSSLPAWFLRYTCLRLRFALA
jgi:hypothetical protein